MYLFQTLNTNGVNGRPVRIEPTRGDKSINREILTGILTRTQLKDPVSSKLNVKGPRQAAALQLAETRYLHKQIEYLPEGLKDQARVNLLLNKNNEQKSLQDYQCTVLGKLEIMLKRQLHEKGEDFHKFRIGGHDEAAYEKFFRIEPKRFMTKAQLFSSIHLIFGEEMIKSQGTIGKLFDSFDLDRIDKMDWRSFLYLLMILMQPTLPCDEAIRWAYALYSSVGSFDITCSEKLSLGILKDMLNAPVLLSFRTSLVGEFDKAWFQLTGEDDQVLQYAAKTQRKSKAVDAEPVDPDDFKIPFKYFNRLLHNTAFAKNMEVATVFGKRDQRPWSYVLEEKFYHPLLLKRLKETRREFRNDDEVVKFREQRDYRKKRFSFASWKAYVARRQFLRFVLITCELRSTLGNYQLYFQHWKKYCIEYDYSIDCQRLIRAYLARRRREFIKRLQKKINLMQKSSRQLLTKKSFDRKRVRLYWAAVSIQRVFRGRSARKRVAHMVEAIYDTEQRRIKAEREEWMRWRYMRAAMAILMCYRKFVRRRNTMRRMHEEELKERVEAEMKRVEEKARLTEELYKQQLSKWYRDRKAIHEENLFHEKQTAQQRKAIIDKRRKAEMIEKERLKRERELTLQHVEDERIELWIKTWEHRIYERGEKRRKVCKSCLVLPETPEEVLLKKDMIKRIKANITEVLRRADKQKIPMEIPEAYKISQDEIIEQEVERAKQQAKDEMKAEGERLEREKIEREKKLLEQELAEKKRKAKWALLTIQSYARIFLSRKRMRQKAYDRYEKIFDPINHEYYYQDKRTKETTWIKPASLGSYDIEMEDYWIMMSARLPDNYNREPLYYYYNPSTWDMQWEQPNGTILCQICLHNFAIIYYQIENISYCENCMYNHVNDLVVNYDVNMKEIVYKVFNGGKTDAITTDVYLLPEENWHAHIMQLDPSLRMTEEEELEEERLVNLKKSKSFTLTKSQKSKKLRNKNVIYCSKCDNLPAEIFCEDCNKLSFCETCDIEIHAIDEKRFHYRAKIMPEKYITLPDISKLTVTSMLDDPNYSIKVFSPRAMTANDALPQIKDKKTIKKKGLKKKKKTKKSDNESEATTPSKADKKRNKHKKKKATDGTASDYSTGDERSKTAPEKSKRKKRSKSKEGKRKVKSANKSKDDSTALDNSVNYQSDFSAISDPLSAGDVSQLSQSQALSESMVSDSEPISRAHTAPAAMNNTHDDESGLSESDLHALSGDESKAGESIPNKEKKVKKKTKKVKKSKSDAEGDATSGNESSPEKKKKKKKKDKSTTDGAMSENSTPEKKKKKKKSSTTQSGDESNSPDKKTKKKKKKKSDALSGDETLASTMKSDGESTAVSRDSKGKKKKKKKTDKKPSTSETGERKKKKKTKDENKITLPPIPGATSL